MNVLISLHKAISK